MSRVYLDWNATAPLRAEARDAMISAMDAVGNPSSVHAEGRIAKGIIERARSQVAQAFGAVDADVVFTSGATESAALVFANASYTGADIEHDCVHTYLTSKLRVDGQGLITSISPSQEAIQLANSETGVVQNVPSRTGLCDAVQGFGKIPFAFDWSAVRMAMISAHKVGGPKGVGALAIQQGIDITQVTKGGGQEMGRRAGTENVIGIAGFGAAAEVSARDLADGVWDQIAELRDHLESQILDIAPDAIIFGKEVKRLPNTSCFAVPGWKGETQVMQMDLAGFAISAGSACSSGKVKSSRVLQAMGFDAITAGSAIRVSMGPTSTKQEIDRFVSAWAKAYQKFRIKAA